MALKLTFILALISAVATTPEQLSSSYGYKQQQLISEPAQYTFEWRVKDIDYSNNFGHKETRDGDKTEGSYYVNLPDGRLQRVSYSVKGDSGFVAKVSYDGEPQYPYPKPQPSYGDRI